MSAESIDVLAALDSVIRDCGLSVVFGRDVRKARAAVAELIEAASKGATMNVVGTSPALYFGPVHAARLRTALARVQGEQS